MTILPPHMDMENFSPNMKRLIEPHMNRYDEWRLSDFTGSVDFSTDPTPRIDLGGQELRCYQRIQKLEFWFSDYRGAFCLCGMRQTWNNKSGTEKTELVVGKTDGKYYKIVWKSAFKAPNRLISASFLSEKITTSALTRRNPSSPARSTSPSWTRGQVRCTVSIPCPSSQEWTSS